MFLDDTEEEGRLVEPLACVSWFDYGQDGQVNGHWDYWYYRHHLGAEGRRDDGQWVDEEAQPDWTKHKHGVRHVHTIALPLVSIANGEELKGLIVEPLLSSIEAETQA